MMRRMLSAETFKKQRTHATPVRGSCLSERSKQKALPSRARRAEGLVILALFLTLAAAPLARAEYAVLRNGQRLHITGYEHLATAYRLQMAGGLVDVAAEDVVAFEPEDSFPAPPPPAASLNVPFGELIRAAASKHGVDQELIASVIAVESNFNPRAVSPKQARGLMQLLPETVARFAVTNVFDPAQNIDAGTRFLKQLLTRYDQDLGLALAAYNAGPDRVEQYRGVPPFPETRMYLRRVARQLGEHKKHKTDGGQTADSTQPAPDSR